MASGEYISFVDSDDFIPNNAIELLYNRICKDDHVGIVSGSIHRYFNGKLSSFNPKWNTDIEKAYSSQDFRIKVMNMSISHTVWNKLYKAELLRNVRFREGRNNEDVLYMYDLNKDMESLEYSIVEIPQYVYYYRYRDDSICTSAKKPLFIDKIQNQIDMMTDCKNNDKELYDVIYHQYVHTLFVFLDSLLLNNIWHPIYFKKYQSLLRKIPFKYIYCHFQLKDCLYILFLKWMPNVRKYIRNLIGYNHIQKN